MRTLLIQVNSQKAYKLLQYLEDLKFIKVLRQDREPGQKLSEKYAGKLPADITDELQNYVEESRNEWSNRNT